MTKLLSNLPIEKLTTETDYLGILDKGKLISEFLKGSKGEFHEIKMFSLYGNWGSGKSSLMKFLENELKSDFNTFFFEAWEFEKDENLAMSLLEFVTKKSEDKTESLAGDILKYGGRILRGLGKSIKINIPLFPNGPAIDLEPAAFVEEMTKNEQLSFYEALEGFKKEFVRMEDFLTKGDSPKYNIIFIDDLDRCEPDQVLNLLSAIKLFFTYGKKTIFFCGVDKKAVEEAVKTKYGEVVKSNEYLEKIFDISFSMPDQYDLSKLINHYFNDHIYQFSKGKISINKRINSFFSALEFTNPRRVKKVLNKFQILRLFKQSYLKADFPNIDIKIAVENSYFETILVLYLIILHEFHPLCFDDFLNFEKKKDIYLNSNSATTKSNVTTPIKNNYSNKSFQDLKQIDFTNPHHQSYFFICVAPINVQKIESGAFAHRQYDAITVNEKYIDFLFYRYINMYNIPELIKNSTSDSSFTSIKKLIKDLL